MDKGATPHMPQVPCEITTGKTAEMIKLSVIQRDKDEGASLVFVREHLDLDAFRRWLIEYHLKRAEYSEAKRLCTEWLDGDRSGLPGLRYSYLKTLLGIARQEDNPGEVQHYARLLFVDIGNFQYYDLLKRSMTSEAWPEFVRALIADLSRSQRGPGVLADVYAHESMWEALFALVKQYGANMLEAYHEQLAPHFPEELGGIYEGAVFEMLKQASSRGTYSTAAEYLRRMKQMGQTKRAEAIVEWLVSTYRNRKAMIDELRGI
jgi:hypothetical protein